MVVVIFAAVYLLAMVALIFFAYKWSKGHNHDSSGKKL